MMISTSSKPLRPAGRSFTYRRILERVPVSSGLALEFASEQIERGRRSIAGRSLHVDIALRLLNDPKRLAQVRPVPGLDSASGDAPTKHP